MRASFELAKAAARIAVLLSSSGAVEQETLELMRSLGTPGATRHEQAYV